MTNSRASDSILIAAMTLPRRPRRRRRQGESSARRRGLSTPAQAVCSLLIAVAVGGCQGGGLPALTDYTPFGPDAKYDGEFGPTAAQKIEQLKKVAAKSATLSPAQQQQTSVSLAEQIRAESDPEVRRHVIQALGRIPTPLSTAVLRAGLESDPNADVRVACCEAFAARAGPDAVAALAAALASDTNVDVRLAATRALGRRSEPGVVQALAVGLDQKEDPAVQYRSMVSLREITGKNLGGNCVAWQQFAASGTVPAGVGPPSLADQLFSWWR